MRPPVRTETEGDRRNTYELVVLAAKRARQLKEGALNLVEVPSNNALTVALAEIEAGKIDADYVPEVAEG
ncbi:MAG: DNA-directed RNA polymerase subunit omega [Armatimonadetes bacterium]|jgi:DNA-directed RNA polymerase omega subunit|nr:DNA-directed RNA polymerase subunit omega [Armatimonadota bacterium]